MYFGPGAAERTKFPIHELKDNEVCIEIHVYKLIKCYLKGTLLLYIFLTPPPPIHVRGSSFTEPDHSLLQHWMAKRSGRGSLGYPFLSISLNAPEIIIIHVLFNIVHVMYRIFTSYVQCTC